MDDTLMNRNLHPRGGRRASLRALAGACWLALTACGGGSGEPPAEAAVDRVVHHWRIAEHRADASTVDLVPLTSSIDQPVYAFADLGEFIIRPPDEGPRAIPEASATAAGDVYWVAAQAPVGDLTKPSSPIGSYAYLDQIQTYRKTSDSGSLDLVISTATLEALDFNPHEPTALECPELSTGKFFFTLAEWNAIFSGLKCVINTKLYYQISAWKDVPIKDASGKVTGYGLVELAHGSAFAHLYGSLQFWGADVGPSGDSNLRFKVAPDYEFDPNVDLDPFAAYTHARLRLKRPTVIEIPLDAVATDEEFKVMVVVSADVNNRRQLESFASARLRDPQRLSGVTFEAQGVELIPIPPGSVLTPPPPVLQPAPACTGATDPAAGTLQFESAAVYAPESSGLGKLLVWVTRSGGGQGEVSALFTTQDGSAHAGVDYQAASSLVRFADGEQGKRFVAIPIIDNHAVDGLRTATLSLSDLHGCAALGPQAQAVLTIIDDDRPPPTTQFGLGGSVAGLTGSGLVLRTDHGDQVQPGGNGAFIFPTLLADGTAYTVSVATQPGNPVQLCGVSRGSGVIAGAAVTDIAVDCSTPPPNGSLDASFGSGGKLTATLTPAKALARQSDGRLLVLGGMTLSRFDADGSVDTAFGVGGKITIVANGGPLDAMQALALQADGRIVVAGTTALPTAFNDDMVVLRFNPDGSADTSFGSGGKVVTDFAGSTDRAYAVTVQGDGRIVVAGFATLGAGAAADQDVALLCILPNGSLDTGFGSGGKVTTNVGGRADFGYALALQADGRIVVAGRVGADGGSNPDVGVLRYLADGSLDASFGSAGKVQVDFGGASWDEAGDVVVQGDGRIVVGGLSNNGGSYRYALLRLNADGTRDSGFGSQGLVSTAFTTQNDYGRALALQADGRIVVAGQVASLGNGDFGIARYLGNGALDTGFGTGGLVRIDFFGAADAVFDVLLQPDGRIVAAGSARNGSSTGLGLVRVLP